MSALETLRTPRLLLTRPVPADCDDVARLLADPVVTATLGGMRSRDETQKIFQRYLDSWERHGFDWWILRDPDSGAFVGRGGLRLLPREDGDEVELGYAFLAPYWGRGLATEFARASVRVAFEVLGRPDVICFTLPTNRASQRVMEKAGFVYERDGVYADLPHVFYRLTAARWRTLQAGEGERSV